MNLWDDIAHNMQNLNRNTLLLQDRAGSIEQKNALIDLQMRIVELEDTIETVREIFT